MVSNVWTSPLFLPWSLPLTPCAPLLKNYSAIPYRLWIKSQFHCLPCKAIPAASVHPLPLPLQGNGLCSSPMGWFTTSQAMPVLLALCLVHGTSSAWCTSSDPSTAVPPPTVDESLVTLQSLAQVQLLGKAFSDILMGWDRGLLLLYAKHAPWPSLYSPSFILPWTVGSSLDVHFPSTRLQARGTETTFYLSLYHPPQSVSFVGT